MNTKKMKSTILAVIAAVMFASCGPDKSSNSEKTIKKKTPSIKLYALECGRIDMLDLSIFDKGGAYDGRTHKAVSSCYLIRHKDGDLLWDTGLPDSIHAMKEGVTNGPFHIEVPTTLRSGLESLGVKPEDIEYLSLSHTHFDHAGNGGAYANANFIVTNAEHDFMFRDEIRKDEQQFPAYSALENAKTTKFSGKYDVFGDGKVEIIELPGHTPGHTVLKLKLDNAGTVLLTGDLYHLKEAREKRTIPVFNTDAEQTLASMDKFEALAKKTNARVIIQHSFEDFNSLPKPPLWLD